MALITQVGGRYSSTLTPPSGSPLNLGVTEDPGYELSFTPEYKLVNNSDAHAANVIEMWWRGFSSVFVDFRAKEWLSGVLKASNPFSAFPAAGTSGAGTFRPGVPGRRGTDLAGILILSATAGTPAAASPASLTATLAILREGFNVKWLFGPDERVTPIGFRLIAYDGGSGAAEYFSVT